MSYVVLRDYYLNHVAFCKVCNQRYVHCNKLCFCDGRNEYLVVSQCRLAQAIRNKISQLF